MNILLHVGSGNQDRPSRWNGICLLYTYLAKSLEALGHDCLLMVHPKAVRDDMFHNTYVTEKVRIPRIFTPDVVFTWNGVSEGDKELIELVGRDKCVFGELGFFDHYSTVYFDFSGTNCRSMNMLEDLNVEPGDDGIFSELKSKYVKPQKFDFDYIFVPFQDELDTQITKYSPFKTMKNLMDWVLDISTFYGPDMKIVYKQHPMSQSVIRDDPRLIEVKDDVHHYLENAKCVIGCNTSVLFECLLYHSRILTIGLGLTSRPDLNEENRKKYVVHCYKKQIHQTKLTDPNVIRESWMYNTLMEKYNGNT